MDNIKTKLNTLSIGSWALVAFALPFSTALTLIFSFFGVAFAILGMRWEICQRVLVNPMVIVLIALYLWLVTSSIWSVAPTAELYEAIIKYRKLLLPIAILIPLIGGGFHAKILLNYLFIGVIIVVVGSIFSSSGLWHYLLGEQVPQGGWALFGDAEKHLFYIGPPSQPTFGRSYIGQGLMLAVGAVIALDRIKTSGREVFLRENLLWIASYLLITYVLWSLNGRTGMVLLIVSSLLWILNITNKDRKRTTRVNYLILLSTLVLTLVLIFPGSQKRLQDIKENAASSITNSSEMSSEGIRLGFWAAGFKMFLHKPIFGWGIGSYAQVYSTLDEAPDELRLSRAQPHSEFVLQGVQGGLVALLLYSTVIYLTLRTYIRARSGEASYAATVCLLTIFIDGCFNSVIWDLAEGHLFSIMIAVLTYEKLAGRISIQTMES